MVRAKKERTQSSISGAPPPHKQKDLMCKGVETSFLPEPYTILYYTLPYYTRLYYTVLYYTILYYTILYYTILYYTILYYTILYYTILYYTILYYTILYYTILYYTILYHTILYCTTLHYTTLHFSSLRDFLSPRVRPQSCSGDIGRLSESMSSMSSVLPVPTAKARKVAGYSIV